MARAGMASLIAFVERLVNDDDNAYHSQDEIEAALDRYRWEARYLELDAVKTKASGGTITYVTFDAPQKWDYWETTAKLYDYNYDELTPDTSDWTAGRWTFATEPTRPVYILGYSYDPYAAAADLLEVRASQTTGDLQAFSTANGSVTFASKRSDFDRRAAEYRRKARSASDLTLISRVDLNPFNG